MQIHLALALAVLVLAPLAALVGLGSRLADEQTSEVERRFEAVIAARLDETAAAAAQAIDGLEGELLAATADLPADSAGLRVRVRSERRFGHLLMFDADGRLTHPPPAGPVSDDERALLERTRGVWESRDFARGARTVSAGEGGSQGKGQHPGGGGGWYIWYWGGGLNLLYRRALADGRTVAVEIDGPRLLAAVISTLPVTTDPPPARGEAPPDPGERMALVDASGRTIYQWGHYPPPPGAVPRVDRPLQPPLEAWRLTWTGPPPPQPERVWLYASLAAIALLLIALAGWFYRASTAELRRAARRMSFVNQVSHELKTPLTNIRMYAELLDDDLDDADERTRRHLGVIVEESQRLSRLIGNILTFARHQREKLTLRPAPKPLDEVIAAVIEQFRPALDEKGITVELDLAAPRPARLDADAIGQILGNLLSNVEKYAATGHLARVTTRQDGPRLTLTVADAGPGIPPRHRERVFEPFHRVSDALSDGVAGTGIGLGIARTLARLHGGDLVLCASDRGATFEASLHAPLVDDPHRAPPSERP